MNLRAPSRKGIRSCLQVEFPFSPFPHREIPTASQRRLFLAMADAHLQLYLRVDVGCEKMNLSKFSKPSPPGREVFTICETCQLGSVSDVWLSTALINITPSFLLHERWRLHRHFRGTQCMSLPTYRNRHRSRNSSESWFTQEQKMLR